MSDEVTPNDFPGILGSPTARQGPPGNGHGTVISRFLVFAADEDSHGNDCQKGE